MKFEFATATRIIFGPGMVEEAAPLAADMGKHAMVVTGQNPDRPAPVSAAMNEKGIATMSFAVPGEPTIQMIRSGVRQAKTAGCDMVIAIGGGSVIDAGKAIAVLLTNPGEMSDYLEVIGPGQPLTQPPAPCIAIPTTAGTGAEVTCNSVIASPDHQVKVSLRSPMMFPRIAIADPELTHSVPPHVTAATGLDALTQVTEAYVSHKATPLTDPICREGIRRAARSLRRVFENGNDRAAREDMALVSLFGGLALANAKLGAVHGLAGPLGGMFPIPHGVICGQLLPHVMAANVRALQMRDPASPALDRYNEVALILTGTADADEGVAWVRELCEAMELPGLTQYGLKAEDFPTVAEKALNASSIKGNPIRLTDEELIGILHQASAA